MVDDDNGYIKLVSKSNENGLLPRGSFLTIDGDDVQFILRVDKSKQGFPYSPSPMIVDMDLTGLGADRKCQNIVHALRVKDVTHRTDGKIDFVKPQSLARRSNQQEVDLAIGTHDSGPRVFIATVHGGQNQLLVDDETNFITARLPDDMFFHQMMVCGKTGSGKTVALKYLAQYFVDTLEGAVLAVNVKDVDFLRMDKASYSASPEVEREWDVLGLEAKGVDNFVVYYPAGRDLSDYRNPQLGLDTERFRAITLSVNDIEPEALSGLLQGISDTAAQNLPDIFRYWREEIRCSEEKFKDFVDYFTQTGLDLGKSFPAMNERGDILTVPLHHATFMNLQRVLAKGTIFFDHDDALVADEKQVLEPGKLTVIDVGKEGLQFGAIVLRHLLRRIVQAKSLQTSSVPVLVIIDEVHNFYRSDASQEALGELDTICRQGRSQKIGVIFSSQNPTDIPRGLDSVINTKIMLRSDPAGVRTQGLGITNDELESLDRGFAVVNVHDAPRLKIVKFPLAPAGVVEGGRTSVE